MKTVDNALTLRVRRLPPKNKPKKKCPPELRLMQNIRYIQRIIRRGEFKHGDKQHEIKLHKAIQLGYVDKELNILREA